MSAPSRPPRRILLIDDQASIHADFRKILCPPAAPGSLGEAKARLFGDAATPPRARAAFEVESAFQGQEGVRAAARARAAQAPFHVAFVDMRMPPGWDGLRTIQALWAEDPTLQVVICTAYSDQSLDEVVAVLGRADQLLVLKKPFEPIEVLQIASALGEKWAAERDAHRHMGELERTVQERTAAAEHAALHDRLTGLPNRALLLDRLAVCVENARRDPARTFALLLVDLDGFKRINDSLGHEIGDRLLVHVAGRLAQGLRTGDLVSRASTPARLGGDEFLVLLEGLSGAADAARVAERLLAALTEPAEIGGHRVAVTACVGITTSERGYRSASEVLRDADIAMDRAKSGPRGRYVLFDEAMHRDVTQRLALEAALREGVEHDALELHYQPVVRLADASLAGFEALVRWSHPEHRSVPAAELIQVAEDTGLIHTLGLQLLRRGCRQLVAWHAAIPESRSLRLSVNLSRRQLVHGELSLWIAEVIRESGIDPTKLSLEVTETSMLPDLEAAVAVLLELRDLGVSLVLDDFGTGYSSISHLHRMPLSAMKIDRSLVTQAQEESRYATALQAIVGIAGAFGLGIVAEGIETYAQLAMVRAFGIEFGQGFLFSRAVPPAEAERMLRSGRPLLPGAE